MSISKFPSKNIVPIQLTQLHMSMPIAFWAPELSLHERPESESGFGSLDLLSHGPVSASLLHPISIKPLSSMGHPPEALRLLWPLASE